MHTLWTPEEVLMNPVSEALKEELKHWEVKLEAEGKIKFKNEPKPEKEAP